MHLHCVDFGCPIPDDTNSSRVTSMSSIDSISLSGMQAAQAQLQASASNIANSDTALYHRRTVHQTPQDGGGVQVSVSEAAQPGADMVTDVITQLQAKNQFLANLSVFKTSNAVKGSLLDIQA